MNKKLHSFAPSLQPPEKVWNLRAEQSYTDGETWLNDRVYGVSQPALGYYPAPKPNGAAAVVCPGGGYQWLSMKHEGVDAAIWLNGLGVSAFVLKSRLHPFHYPAPMEDLAAALQLVRASAPVLGLETGKVGVLGFSAGGHLAASACVAPPAQEAAAGVAGPFDGVPPPAFAVLLYPVISMKAAIPLLGSRDHLLGGNASPGMMDAQSLQSRVCPATPPTLLIHCNDDDVVPSFHSELYYHSLRRVGVRCSLHLFPRGGHGFGTDASDPLLRTWSTLAAHWMKAEAQL